MIFQNFRINRLLSQHVSFSFVALRPSILLIIPGDIPILILYVCISIIFPFLKLPTNVQKYLNDAHVDLIETYILRVSDLWIT